MHPTSQLVFQPIPPSPARLHVPVIPLAELMCMMYPGILIWACQYPVSWVARHMQGNVEVACIAFAASVRRRPRLLSRPPRRGVTSTRDDAVIVPCSPRPRSAPAMLCNGLYMCPCAHVPTSLGNLKDLSGSPRGR